MVRIIDDSRVLLIAIYNNYVTDYDAITPEKILKITKLGGHRTDMALKYLRDSGILDYTVVLGSINKLQSFISFRKLPPKAINIIENKKLFKTTFGTIKGWIER